MSEPEEPQAQGEDTPLVRGIKISIRREITYQTKNLGIDLKNQFQDAFNYTAEQVSAIYPGFETNDIFQLTNKLVPEAVKKYLRQSGYISTPASLSGSGTKLNCNS